MKISIDTNAREIDANGKLVDLYSDEGFRLISDLWVKVGWNQKYSYTFSWFGIPVIQLPEDMLRYQEAVFPAQARRDY